MNDMLEFALLVMSWMTIVLFTLFTVIVLFDIKAARATPQPLTGTTGPAYFDVIYSWSWPRTAAFLVSIFLVIFL